jgi:hypothetical protein
MTTLLTSLAELRTTKLAGGDISLPTYSRPTCGGSAIVDSSSVLSRSSTATCLEELAQRLPGTPGACICTGPLIETHLEPILFDRRSKVSFIDPCTPFLRFTSIATAVVA